MMHVARQTPQGNRFEGLTSLEPWRTPSGRMSLAVQVGDEIASIFHVTPVQGGFVVFLQEGDDPALLPNFMSVAELTRIAQGRRAA